MSNSLVPCFFPSCSLKLLSTAADIVTGNDAYYHRHYMQVCGVQLCVFLPVTNEAISQSALGNYLARIAGNSFKLTHTLASDSPSPTAQELLRPSPTSSLASAARTTRDYAACRSNLEPIIPASSSSELSDWSRRIESLPLDLSAKSSALISVACDKS